MTIYSSAAQRCVCGRLTSCVQENYNKPCDREPRTGKSKVYGAILAKRSKLFAIVWLPCRGMASFVLVLSVLLLAGTVSCDISGKCHNPRAHTWHLPPWGTYTRCSTRSACMLALGSWSAWPPLRWPTECIVSPISRLPSVNLLHIRGPRVESSVHVYRIL